MGQIYILTHTWRHLKFTPATIIKGKQKLLGICQLSWVQTHLIYMKNLFQECNSVSQAPILKSVRILNWTEPSSTQQPKKLNWQKF